MPCECYKIRRKFFSSAKHCKSCKKPVCKECLNKCRLCQLKEIVLNDTILIQMSEEELIELAEVHHVTIMPGKLLKSEIVRLILNNCKGLKFPSGSSCMPKDPTPPPFHNSETIAKKDEDIFVSSSDTKVNRGEEQIASDNAQLHTENMNLTQDEGSKEKPYKLTNSLKATEEEPLVFDMNKIKICEDKSQHKEIKVTSTAPEFDKGHDNIFSSKTVEQDVTSDYKSFLHKIDEMKPEDKMLSEEFSYISLNSISSSEEIFHLNTDQLLQILNNSNVAVNPFIAKEEMLFRVLQLWIAAQRQDNSQAEMTGGRSDNQLKMSANSIRTKPLLSDTERYINAKKRRCIYIINDDSNDDVFTSGINNANLHLKTATSKMSKFDANKSPKSYTAVVSNSAADLQSNLTLECISDASQIENLSIENMQSILKAKLIDCSRLTDKWTLAYKVLSLWHKTEMDQGCIICMEAPVNSTFLECGHTATCMECGQILKYCPVCRKKIDRIVRIFKP